MDNPIVVVENKVIVKQNFSEELAEVIRAKKKIEEAEKKLKEQLEDAIRSVVPSDKTFTFENEFVKISLGTDTYAESFDSKAFKKGHEELYNEYVKISPRKGALKITCKD